MKNILLIGLLFVSSVCTASNSAIFEKLNVSLAPTPVEILTKLENQYLNKAVIVEFELEFDNGRTTYEVTLYQASHHRFIELLVDEAGKLEEFEYEAPEIDDQEEIAAAKLMSKKNLLMQSLVNELAASNNHFLIEAQLEQDMGVTYMVATFVSSQGRYKKAFDLVTGKNLPLLRWGN